MAFVTSSSKAGAWRGARADWRSSLARFGLSAKGILYIAIGMLAINVAAGDAASSSATQQGAIQLVASQPLGRWLIITLTVGLFALAVWQFILAATGDPVEGSDTSDRVKYAVKGVLYLGTAMTALSITLAQWNTSFGSGLGQGGSVSEQEAAAEIMSWPAGPWIAAIIGLAIIAVGIYQLHHHALQKRFMRRLDCAGSSPEVAHGIERAGQAGYAARGIVFTIAGIFLVIAALQHDPQDAVGLSGALQALAQRSWGQIVLWGVAIGLFLFGCFSFAEARYRRAA